MTRHHPSSQRGAAAVEMALLLPLLLFLIFGGLEAGHFIWTQHKLTEAVRNGARYTSRLDVTDVCPTLNADALARIKLLTRTGQLTDTAAKSLVPGWTDDQIIVTPFCDNFVSTGIYNDLKGASGPLVTIEAKDVPYPYLYLMVFRPADPEIRVGASGAKLKAQSTAAVIGL